MLQMATMNFTIKPITLVPVVDEWPRCKGSPCGRIGTIATGNHLDTATALRAMSLYLMVVLVIAGRRAEGVACRTGNRPSKG